MKLSVYPHHLLVALSLFGTVLTSFPAWGDVVKGQQCHPGSPVGFCCPNDGRPSGPYCPDRRKTFTTRN
ncbi:MAG: hypothetical protein KME08_21485 [Aphanothece sp. CMT-3BRIN-NPC111]|nr:hypothetical protein [Aphanothece sp. CMT-3BRIN-NPC111]